LGTVCQMGMQIILCLLNFESRHLHLNAWHTPARKADSLREELISLHARPLVKVEENIVASNF
jgi:hypothetical protein